MTTEAANLFPIYESPQQVFNFPDLDSTAGSEWDEDGGSSHQHLSAISKEQLFQMLQKARARYHKYKGRYSDVAKAYQDLDRENGKIKTVMQQTQVYVVTLFFLELCEDLIWISKNLDIFFGQIANISRNCFRWSLVYK